MKLSDASPIDGFGSKGFSLYSQQRNTKDFWKVNTVNTQRL
jgi:hypothetical protein